MKKKDSERKTGGNPFRKKASKAYILYHPKEKRSGSKVSGPENANLDTHKMQLNMQ